MQGSCLENQICYNLSWSKTKQTKGDRNGKTYRPKYPDAFLNTARKEKSEVVFHLMQGSTLTGSIKSFDKFAVLLWVGDDEMLIFKHAISTVSVKKNQQQKKLTVKYLGRKTDNL